MAGTFDKTDRPALAGSYFNWEAEAEQTSVASLEGIAGAVITADWGPVNTVVPVSSPARFLKLFGSTAGKTRNAITRLFRGQNLPGKGGASEVLVYRAATAAAAASIATLKNTAGTDALRLTARYPGTRADAFRFTVQPSATGGKKDLLVIDGTSVIATHTFTATDVVGLAAEITALNGFFTAASLVSGVALADVASSPAAGGNNGAVLTNTEHVAAMAAFEGSRVGTVAVPNVTLDATITAWAAWTKAVNDRGKRLFTVVGGGDTDALTVVGARAKAINHWNTLVVGASVIRDPATGEVLYPADQVAIIAGAVAFNGERRDMIFMRFGGYEFVSGPDLAGQEYALANGFITFSGDTNATAPVFVREGVTSYTDDSGSEVVDGVKTHSVDLYKRIKNVRTQHLVEMEVDEWATSGDVLGEVENSETTRGILQGYIVALLQRRVDARIVQEGFSVEIDDVPEPDDDQDFVQYRWSFHPTRAVRQMFNTARIG